jgi:uncharacterized membrane protein YfcA
MTYLFVLVTAVIAGAIGGVIGTGSSLILLPVLVHAFGPLEAMPIMAIAAVLGNVSRVIAWWREVDWRAAAVYSVAGVPAAALGARTLLGLPASTIEAALGLFFWLLIPLRRRLRRARRRLGLSALAACGAIIGFLTGLVLSTGPLSVPAFSAYGLSGGAFLGTEAASSVLLYASKITTFAGFGSLPGSVVLNGLLVGTGLMAGTAASRPAVLALSPGAFHQMLDVLLLVSGAVLMQAAWSGR